MLSKKPLILTLIIAFSVHCSKGLAQENGLSLGFALAVGKALINAPKPFIEVLFIKGAYVTGIEEESETIEWWELTQSPDSAVHSRAVSDSGSNSEDNSTSDESSDNRSNGDETDVQYETTTLNPFRVSNQISQYGAAPALKKIKEEPVSDSEIATNDTSGTSDKSIDNRSNEDESDPRYVTTTLNPFRVANEISQYGATLALKKMKEEPASDSEIVPYSTEDQRPKRAKAHQCDHEGCDYRTDYLCNLKNHKQTHLPADQRLKVHQCDHEGCDYRTDWQKNLKRHKQTHLPANQRHKRAKVQQCDHEGCDYRTGRPEDLKRHKQIHLAANQRLRVHHCDHQSCDYRTERPEDLKRHKQTHLPVDQKPKRPRKPKRHQCDHEDCNFSSEREGHLKRHKQTHLPTDQRVKEYQCDHEGCDYGTYQASDLKKHKQTHLPINQRLKVHHCDYSGCNYSTDRTGNLKKHKQTHLPPGQRLKRKAYDQPPSNEKRKKGDKE